MLTTAGVGKAVGTGVKAYGDALGAVRGFLEGVDTFVGKSVLSFHLSLSSKCIAARDGHPRAVSSNITISYHVTRVLRTAGRYLVVGTTVYIAFKFAHYKLFNDIFP